MTPDTARRSRPPRTSVRLVAAASAVGLTALAGCGTSLLGSAATTAPGGSTTSTTAAGAGSTPTTVPINGEVAVAFPVVACTAPTDGGAPVKARSGWNPSILLAPVPTSLVGKVTFYTDGAHTLLGPTGWTCAQVSPGASSSAGAGGTGPTATVPGQAATVPTSGQPGAIAARGGTTLAVFPPNDPDPPVSGPPAPGTEGIFATWATTGTDAGVDMVCPFFTLPAWQVRSAGCTTARPQGETTDVLTPDVTQVTDPAGVVGNLAGSGGQGPSTGVVLFPQIPSAISYGSPIAVAMESCSLSDASLCPTVLSDFDVREFPVPATG